MPRRYDPAEVAAILGAYRALFPTETTALRRYWDLDRHEAWGGLTTDFWRVDYPDFAAFDGGHAAAVGRGTAAQRGAALARYQGGGRVGYSLGLSPWTDRLLLDSYRPGQPVTLVLGHDWHPIARDLEDGTPDHAASPLEAAAITPLYRRALPPRESTLLFLNLYPHFRPPGASPMGRIPGVDYRAAVAGLGAVVEALAQAHHPVSGLISWGSVVWQALGRGRGPAWQGGITAAWQRVAATGPLPLPLGPLTLPYAPFLHPSAYPFGTPAHRAAYQAAWARIAGRGTQGSEGPKS